MAVLPNALEVRIDPEFADQGSKRQSSGENRTTRTPAELFGDFCATRNVSDPRVATLFGELHDDVTSADSADLSAAS
jgi:exonuclease SbcD